MKHLEPFNKDERGIIKDIFNIAKDIDNLRVGMNKQMLGTKGRDYASHVRTCDPTRKTSITA